MEVLSYLDYNNTLIGYHLYYESERREQDICKSCESIQDKKYTKYLFLKYYHGLNINCKCKSTGKTNYIAVQVKAQGQPISVKPNQTIYEICIWDLNRPLRSECNIELLQGESPTYQFMLDFAEDDIDLDYSNQKIIIEYEKYLTNLTLTNFTFRGVSSINSYYQNYLERIEKIKSGKPRLIQLKEDINNHIGIRRKGHSHLR